MNKSTRMEKFVVGGTKVYFRSHTDRANAERLAQRVATFAWALRPQGIEKPKTVIVMAEVDGNKCVFDAVLPEKKTHLATTIERFTVTELRRIATDYRWPIVCAPFKDEERKKFGHNLEHPPSPKQVQQLLKARGISNIEVDRIEMDNRLGGHLSVYVK